ncbi:MAG: NUDIX domain-containing protein [Bacteroidetes bacterium]|nr:NUDIX domain-containing protein [Bacteroidota bacterium]
MAADISAGLLMYSFKNNELKVFLVHPGGPYYVNKDDGYWGIPKGLSEKNEELLYTAIREFKEETGITPHGDFIPLSLVKQKNGKTVYAWAFQTENDNQLHLSSNTFEMEWPPHSGVKKQFPEIDKGEFFTIDEAKNKILEAQREFITKLERHLKTI